jgi:hypothetical protein
MKIEQVTYHYGNLTSTSQGTEIDWEWLEEQCPLSLCDAITITTKMSLEEYRKMRENIDETVV